MREKRKATLKALDSLSLDTMSQLKGGQQFRQEHNNPNNYQQFNYSGHKQHNGYDFGTITNKNFN